MITRQKTAEQLTSYLNHKITLEQLVEWAENSIMEGDMEPDYAKPLMKILGQLAAADVKEFGLLWEDCEKIMNVLGYDLKVNTIIAA
jgi:hypothetical protein